MLNTLISLDVLAFVAFQSLHFTVGQKNHPTNSSPPVCAETLVVVAVMTRPPYVINVTAGDRSKLGMISQLLKILDSELDHKSSEECLFGNLTFTETNIETTLKNYITRNSTDIAFPIFASKGTKKFLKKPFLAIMDHPGMNLLVLPKAKYPVQTCVNTILNSWPLLALAVILTGIAGVIVWFCETLSNREEFPRSFLKGSWEGFWWAFISITTVGYGDKCPRSVGGRCFAVLWIFTGLIMLAVFMANVTMALTSMSVKPEYQLDHMEVAVFKNSTDEVIAREQGANTKGFESFEDMVTALYNNAVQGILVDRYTASYFLQVLQIRTDTKTSNKAMISAKQLTATGYQVGMVLGSKAARTLTAFQLINSEGVFDEDVQRELNSAAIHYGQEIVLKHLKLVKTNIPITASFNLFVDSKDAMHLMVYVSLAVLVVTLVLGRVIEGIIWEKATKRCVKQGSQDTIVENVSLSSTKPVEEQLEKELSEGKKILADLHNYFERLELILKKRKEWRK